MAKQVFDVGRDGLLFIGKSTATGFTEYVQADDRVADDGVNQLTATLTFEQEQRIREDKNDSRSVLEMYRMRKAGTFDLSTYTLPAGSGKVPDIWELLEAFFSVGIGNKTGGADVFSNILAGSDQGALSTEINVTDGDIVLQTYAVDQGCVVEGLDGNNYLRIITALNAGKTEAGPINVDGITVRPKIPFAAIPDATKKFHKGWAYKLQKNVVDKLVAAFMRSNECYVATGVVPGEIVFEMSGTDAMKTTITGLVGDVPQYAGTAKITNAVGAGTSIEVAKGDGLKFTDGSLVTFFDVANNVLKDEKCRINVNGINRGDTTKDVITVTRALGGTPYVAAINDELTPWRPTPTVTGNVIGQLVLPQAGVVLQQSTDATKVSATASGDDHSYQVNTARVRISNAAELINEQYGDDKAVDYKVGRVEAIVELEAFMSKDMFREYGRASVFEDVPVLLVKGKDLGKMIGFWMPKVRFFRPTADDVGNDELVRVSFRGQAQGTSGQDEVYLIGG